MLVIRLARGGRTKYPVYRIVAAESSRAATGKFVEVLGHYNPHTKELVIKKEEIIKRLNHGAQPSNSVAKLLMQEKIELPSWVKIKERDRKPKKEPKAEAAPAEAPKEEASGEPESSETAEPAETLTETESKEEPAQSTDSEDKDEESKPAAE